MFSLNNKVSVTGMTVTTKVGNNLLIATAANTETTNAPATSTAPAAAYGTALIQTKDGILEPVSSIDGQYNTFWYTDTTNVNSSGDANSENYTAYPADGALTAFRTTYGDSTAQYVGYVDYVFMLQATNSSPSIPQRLNMTKCDLAYNGTADDTTGMAYRMAILVQDAGTDGTAASNTVNPVTLLGSKQTSAPTASDYFTKNSTTPQAIIAATGAENVTHGDITVYNQAATIGTLAAQATHYYKVTARLWLEGEDTTCNNSTYAPLATGAWSLDLAFELQPTKDGNGDDIANNAVTAITKTARTLYTLTADTATSGDPVVVNTVTYYPFSATGGTIYTTSNSAVAANDSRLWYTINNQEIYDVTDYVTIN